MFTFLKKNGMVPSLGEVAPVAVKPKQMDPQTKSAMGRLADTPFLHLVANPGGKSISPVF